MSRVNRDELQWDVLTCLILSVNLRLQWKELRDNLHKKYSKYDRETFEVILSRALHSLVSSGDLKKDNKSHQEVYYYVPKGRQQKIIDGVSKRFLYKKIDEFWDRFSIDQKKRAAKELAYSQSLMIQNEKKFLNEMLTFLSSWANELKLNLMTLQKIKRVNILQKSDQNLTKN